MTLRCIHARKCLTTFFLRPCLMCFFSSKANLAQNRPLCVQYASLVWKMHGMVSPQGHGCLHGHPRDVGGWEICRFFSSDQKIKKGGTWCGKWWNLMISLHHCIIAIYHHHCGLAYFIALGFLGLGISCASWWVLVVMRVRIQFAVDWCRDDHPKCWLSSRCCWRVCHNGIVDTCLC